MSVFISLQTAGNHTAFSCKTATPVFTTRPFMPFIHPVKGGQIRKTQTRQSKDDFMRAEMYLFSPILFPPPLKMSLRIKKSMSLYYTCKIKIRDGTELTMLWHEVACKMPWWWIIKGLEPSTDPPISMQKPSIGAGPLLHWLPGTLSKIAAFFQRKQQLQSPIEVPCQWGSTCK